MPTQDVGRHRRPFTVLLLVARRLHAVLGAFWFGAVIFKSFFPGPALQDVGPERRKWRDGVHVHSRHLLTISGLWLYGHMSAGFTPQYMGSHQGQTLGLGAVMSIVSMWLGSPSSSREWKKRGSCLTRGSGQRQRA